LSLYIETAAAAALMDMDGDAKGGDSTWRTWGAATLGRPPRTRRRRRRCWLGSRMRKPSWRRGRSWRAAPTLGRRGSATERMWRRCCLPRSLAAFLAPGRVPPPGVDRWGVGTPRKTRGLGVATTSFWVPKWRTGSAPAWASSPGKTAGSPRGLGFPKGP
jgi:hypothetical protein